MIPEYTVNIPFVSHLGIQVASYENGHSELHFDTRQEHENSFAVTHGGALMTLLDVSMASAARSVQKDMGVVTIEMKTTFMKPARGKLIGRGHLMHRTGSMAFVEASVIDADGNVCAHSTGTFKYVKRRPTDPNAGTEPVISTD